ncbi:TrmH family RNA methyltransferase [Enterovirga sp.]|uniref:RNA methyltransferase n=1 Tax=Enterovirga sp. TaxID=2026350 RepID=UPI002613F75A|nr:TrmH family RNA methyltransferase [Enterovirga sp.]MDB5591853.1 methyltransferase, TrmH family, group 1 [Enterovirga sp.]
MALPPAIILVEPQLPENIGMAARAMANFGLPELRLVAPREGWPHEGARSPAAGATAILDAAAAFASTAEAVGDLAYVVATTARSRGQMKRVLTPWDAMAELRSRSLAGQRTAILFGRERTGLSNDDVSVADAILTFPVDPAFTSLNLAAAVLLAGYEWRRSGEDVGAVPAAPSPAPRAALLGLFAQLEGELDAVGYYPAGKRPSMTRNMRDMLLRLAPTEQDVRTWRGVLRALSGSRPRRKG